MSEEYNNNEQNNQTPTDSGNSQFAAWPSKISFTELGNTPPASESYTAPEAETKHTPPKKKKGALVFAAVMAVTFLITSCLLGFTLYVSQNGDDIGGASANDSSKDHVSQIVAVVTNPADDTSSTEEDKDYSQVVGTENTDDENEPIGNVDIATLYKEVSQSCVSIKCSVKASSAFYGTYETVALGSGFAITKDGYIVTNHHVIEGATSIKVVFYDGTEVDAELIGSDSVCDLAVLKIKTDKELVPVAFGDSDKVEVGEWVIAVGTPSDLTFAGTLTYGVVSGVNRKIPLTDDYGTVTKTMTLIQTDATLNPGNSGGPLFNMKGQVIGINTLKLINTYEGIGFAIPSTGAVDIINELIANGKVSSSSSSYASGTPKLGIEGATVSDESKEHFNLPDSSPEGVYVSTVNRNSAVYEQGLSAHDIITKFNGKEVKTMEELKELLVKCNAGDTATMEFYRLSRKNDGTGEYFNITFKLDSQS